MCYRRRGQRGKRLTDIGIDVHKRATQIHMLAESFPRGAQSFLKMSDKSVTPRKPRTTNPTAAPRPLQGLPSSCAVYAPPHAGRQWLPKTPPRTRISGPIDNYPG